MAFSEARALPGAALRLQLGAAPGSLCAVRAVDHSVLLLKPKAELNAEAVSVGPAWGPPAAPRAAWAGVGWYWLKCPSHGPSAAVGRALCSGNEDFARLYSQVFKALPEFNYPHSIQDDPLCDFDWQDAKREPYQLFQVKTKGLPVPPHPGAAHASPKCWESHTYGKGLPLPAKPRFLPHLYSVALGLLTAGTGIFLLLAGGEWTTSPFSQDAALKLFTKTKEPCPPRLPVVGGGHGGEHSPCAEKSKELVASPGCCALREPSRKHPRHQRGWTRMEKDFGHPCAGCRQGPAEP